MRTTKARDSRNARWAAAAGAAVLALVGCSTESTPADPTPTGGDDASEAPIEMTTVRVGYIPGAHDVAQLFVAEEQGHFASLGIELELTAFQTGISLAQALTGGSLDMGVMGAVVANFPARGQGQVIALNNQQVDIHQIWATSESGITSIDQLEGATIATTTGTASDVVLQAALDQAGLTRDDVEVVNLEMPSVANTFVTGGVDVASLWSPFDGVVEENMPDAVLVATAADLDSPISGGWVVNNEFYEGNPDVVEALVRAWQLANDDIVDSPTGMTEVFCPGIEENMDQERCEDLFELTDTLSNEEWAALYEDGTAHGWLRHMQETFQTIGAIEGDVMDPEEYFDASIFSRVLADS